MNFNGTVVSLSGWILCAALMGGHSLLLAEEAAVVDDSASAKKLQNLKRRPGAKPIITIYEVRSTVPEVQPKAAQEMFMTALIKSGAFAVAERQRLNEGVMREKQLNATGVTTGDTGAAKLAGASYVLEVIISEANAGEKKSQSGVNVGGLDVNIGSAKDSIGMDVRIVDAASGLLVDAVNVKKSLESSNTSVSGVGQALKSLLSLKGRSAPPVNLDANINSTRKEGVDRAVRSCIDVAVAELAKRLTED
jgi:curli biogenesis system outer membrane secretion channel CsgG